MNITLTTLRWVPPLAVGLVREIRVRWALEEAGRPYQVRLIGPEDQSTPAYRQQQPFGQIPVYQEDGLTLFESGAILRHIARTSPALMPADAAGREQVTSWLFAALNSIEPHLQNLVELDLFAAGEPWAQQRRPALLDMANKRLGDLNSWLRERDYLCGQFSVADILMATVLGALRHTGVVGQEPALVAQQPALFAWYRRCLARPAYARAMADHRALYAPEGQPVAA